MAVDGLYVRISMERSSARFIKAFAQLMASIEFADPVMLEDEIAAAHAEVKAALQDTRAIALEEDV